MKMSKKMFTLLAMLFLFVGSVMGSTLSVSAAGTIPLRIKITPEVVLDSAVQFDLPEVGDTVGNIKSNSKNLYVKQTKYSVLKSSHHAWANENKVAFGMYAKKSGKYKVSFAIYGANGKKKSTHTITVYAVNSGEEKELPAKSVKYGGVELISRTEKYSMKAKGKIKVVMNKGYKFKRIEVGKYNHQGEMVYTPIKNGAVVTLSKVPYSMSDKSGELTEDYYRNMWAKKMTADTDIRIVYIDKYTKELDSVSYRISKFVK